MVDNEQNNNGAALDIRLAHQAGVLCRDCDTRITGEVSATFGRCHQCRPNNPHQEPAATLAAGCPGEPDTYTNHVPSSTGPCAHRALPLPKDYHLVLEKARRVEQRQRE